MELTSEVWLWKTYDYKLTILFLFKNYEFSQIEIVKKLILRSCDMDKDGRISKKELLVILNAVMGSTQPSEAKKAIKSRLLTCN